jgi:hypothetical protein
MAAPGIKGSVFVKSVEDVNKLLDQGDISADELARRLPEADRDLLQQSINLATWYDIEAYDRIVRLLLDVEGGGNTNYLVERGRATAERLMEGGLYQQFEYLNRTTAVGQSDPEESFEAYGRDLRLLGSLSGSLLNFSKWTTEPDPDPPQRWMFRVTECASYPDTLAWTTMGVMNRMVEGAGSGISWTWKRVRRDEIIFRMDVKG